MADIPIIPGVSVATKGILNKPIKDIICAILFGGINNMLKGPLLCVNFDLDKMATEAGLAGLEDLKDELKNLKDQLKAAEELAGIPETLARVNAAIAEVQSLLALDGLCAVPLKAPLITDVIGQVIDAEYREMNAILNDIGRLAKPSVCLNGNGGFGLGGGYNPDSILGSLSKHLGNLGSIPAQQLDALKKRLQCVGKALNKSINRQLFPDFRHKHNLTTGRPYVPKQTYKGAGVDAPSVSVLRARLATEASAQIQAALAAEIAKTENMPVPVITLAPAPPLVNQWNGPYPPPDVPNLKNATATAQTLVASIKQTGSYPVEADGITHANLWLPMLGPEVYSLAIDALTPQDPFFSQQEPIYDYCGKLVGYTSTLVSGNANDVGGNPLVGATLEPPKTTFNFSWIADRNCWAVTGNTSEQIMDVGQDKGRKGVYLNKNPDVILHRGYNHTFSIPSIDISGSGIAPEFFVCYVDENLQPRKMNDQLELFNLGLARLETYELLEDANGSFNSSYALERKTTHPFGTTLYFAAEQRVYSGNEAPVAPTENVWWYNLVTCDTKRFVLNRDADKNVVNGTGTWVDVSNEQRKTVWFGSSNVYNAPNANYLAYSNKDGSVFGLIKLV